jgi:hypothetical protein
MLLLLLPLPCFRENLEGEYSGLEHEVVDGVVESLKVRKSKVVLLCGKPLCNNRTAQQTGATGWSMRWWTGWWRASRCATC